MPPTPEETVTFLTRANAQGRAHANTLDRELTQALALLVDADEVARARGDKHGLCDSIDRRGNPYPSSHLADVLKKARARFGEAGSGGTGESRWARPLRLADAQPSTPEQGGSR